MPYYTISSSGRRRRAPQYKCMWAVWVALATAVSALFIVLVLAYQQHRERSDLSYLLSGESLLGPVINNVTPKFIVGDSANRYLPRPSYSRAKQPASDLVTVIPSQARVKTSELLFGNNRAGNPDCGFSVTRDAITYAPTLSLYINESIVRPRSVRQSATTAVGNILDAVYNPTDGSIFVGIQQPNPTALLQVGNCTFFNGSATVFGCTVYADGDLIIGGINALNFMVNISDSYNSLDAIVNGQVASISRILRTLGTLQTLINMLDPDIEADLVMIEELNTSINLLWLQFDVANQTLEYLIDANHTIFLELATLESCCAASNVSNLSTDIDIVNETLQYLLANNRTLFSNITQLEIEVAELIASNRTTDLDLKSITDELKATNNTLYLWIAAFTSEATYTNQSLATLNSNNYTVFTELAQLETCCATATANISTVFLTLTQVEAYLDSVNRTLRLILSNDTTFIEEILELFNEMREVFSNETTILDFLHGMNVTVNNNTLNINTLTLQILALQGEIVSVSNNLTAATSALNTSIQFLLANDSAIWTQITDIYGEIVSVSNNLTLATNALNATIQFLLANDSALWTQIVDIYGEIASVSTNLTTLNTTIQFLLANDSALWLQITDIYGEIASVSNNLTNLIAVVNTTLVSLQTQINTIDGDLALVAYLPNNQTFTGINTFNNSVIVAPVTGTTFTVSSSAAATSATTGCGTFVGGISTGANSFFSGTNIFGATSGQIQLGTGSSYTTLTCAPSGIYQLTVPTITENDTIATLGMSQTYTGVPNFSNGIQINGGTLTLGNLTTIEGEIATLNSNNYTIFTDLAQLETCCAGNAANISVLFANFSSLLSTVQIILGNDTTFVNQIQQLKTFITSMNMSIYEIFGNETTFAQFLSGMNVTVNNNTLNINILTTQILAIESNLSAIWTQINGAAYLANTQTFTGVNTFNNTVILNTASRQLQIGSGSSYTTLTCAPSGIYQLTIPTVTSNDTFATLGLSQTYTGIPNFSNGIQLNGGTLTLSNLTTIEGEIATLSSNNNTVFTDIQALQSNLSAVWIQLNGAAYLANTQTFTRVNTFNNTVILNAASMQLQLGSGSSYTTLTCAPSGIYQLTIPTVASNDTFATLGLSQTFTGANTFGNSVTISPSSGTTLTISSTAASTSAVTGNSFVTSGGIGSASHYVSGKIVTATQLVSSATSNQMQLGSSLTITTAQSTAYTLTIPTITAADTLATLKLAQTFTKTNTFSGSIVLSATSGITLTVDSTNAATSATTGAATIAGGISTGANSFFSGTNIFGATSRQIQLGSGASYTTLTCTPSGVYQLTVPTITANDTIATLGMSQTFTGANTFASSVTMGSSAYVYTNYIASVGNSGTIYVGIHTSTTTIQAYDSTGTVNFGNSVTGTYNFYGSQITLNNGLDQIILVDSSGYALTLTTNGLSAPATLKFPSIGSSDTLATLNVANVFTSANTFTNAIYSNNVFYAIYIYPNGSTLTVAPNGGTLTLGGSSGTTTLKCGQTSGTAITVSSTNAATSATTGAATFAGGISTGANSFFSGTNIFGATSNQLQIGSGSSYTTITSAPSGVYTLTIPTLSASDTVALLSQVNAIDTNVMAQNAYVTASNTVLNTQGITLINCANALTGLTLPNATTVGTWTEIKTLSKQCVQFGIAMQRGTIVMNSYNSYRRLVYTQNAWQTIGEYESYVPTAYAWNVSQHINEGWGGEGNVALTADGNTVYVGDGQQYVRSWVRTATTGWVQSTTFGAGSTAGALAQSVAVSGDQKTMVYIAAASNTPSTTQLIVYTIPADTYVTVYIQSGVNQTNVGYYSIAVNTNGTVVVAGATTDTQCGNLGGAIVYYRLNTTTTTWVNGTALIGGSGTGCSRPLYQGYNVAINGDGSLIASTSALPISGTTTTANGTYFFRMTGPGTWTQSAFVQHSSSISWIVGMSQMEITGTQASTDMTADGNTFVIAATAMWEIGAAVYTQVTTVLVYSLTSSVPGIYLSQESTPSLTDTWTDTWTLTATIQIPNQGIISGTLTVGVAVAISDDGNSIAVSQSNTGSSLPNSYLFTYVKNGATWGLYNQIAQPLTGRGYAISMTPDGRTVAVGPSATGNNDATGKYRGT